MTKKNPMLVIEAELEISEIEEVKRIIEDLQSYGNVTKAELTIFETTKIDLR